MRYEMRPVSNITGRPKLGTLHSHIAEYKSPENAVHWMRWRLETYGWFPEGQYVVQTFPRGYDKPVVTAGVLIKEHRPCDDGVNTYPWVTAIRTYE